MVAGMLGHGDPALDAFAEAGAMLDQLSRADATNRDSRRSRAGNAVRRADALVARGDLAAARALLVPGIAVLEELMAADPARLALREDLIHALTTASALELGAGRPEAARDHSAAAGRLLPDSVPAGASRRMLRHGAELRLLEGRGLALLGDPGGATAKWKEVERLTAPLLAAGDDPPALASAAEALLHLARRAEAERLLSRLRKTGFREAGFVKRLDELGVRY
jgi:tetratricopeptide (TPR) repeat protein